MKTAPFIQRLLDTPEPSSDSVNRMSGDGYFAKDIATVCVKQILQQHNFLQNETVLGLIEALALYAEMPEVFVDEWNRSAWNRCRALFGDSTKYLGGSK